MIGEITIRKVPELIADLTLRWISMLIQCLKVPKDTGKPVSPDSQ